MSKTKSITFIITGFLLFLPVLLLAGTIQLPQTGQTKCYNSAGLEIGCAGTGQDGEIQAGVAWPKPRFKVSIAMKLLHVLTNHLTVTAIHQRML